MGMAIEVFTVVCAWCDRVMSNDQEIDQEMEDETKQRLTHSICTDCFDSMRSEIASLQSQLSPKRKVSSLP